MTARDVPYAHRANRHPDWCDRSLCELEHCEVNHRSGTTELLGESTWMTTHLWVSDELFADEPQFTNLVLEVKDLYCTDGATVLLSLADVRAWRDLLTEQLERGEAAELADPVYFAGGGG